MAPERRYLWLAIGVVTLISVGLLVVPRLREEFAPEPVSALVAVEIVGSGVAATGAVRVAAGERFLLHAVLVAADRKGEPVYYSPAPALRIAGEPVAPDRLRAWDRRGEIAVLWFTVEGFRPFARVETVERLADFRFEESFRPEWGRGWTIPGSVTPRNHALARGFEPDQDVPFGTARYHVRIEKYFRAGDPAPLARYRSPGAATVFDGEAGPTRVQASLPGALARVSTVFGTPQLEPAANAPPAVLRELSTWYARSLAFSRLLVLGGLLEDRGLAWSDLDWQSVEVDLEPVWGAAGVEGQIGAGDLLRSGERIVVLYEDRGDRGRLDYEDLCFDLVESAAVRRLSEVFSGGGVLEWADSASEDTRDRSAT